MDYMKFLPTAFRKTFSSSTLDTPSTKKAEVISIVPKAEIVKSNSIQITYNDNSYSLYTVKNCSDDPIQPWEDFYNWYNEGITQHYIFSYENGVRMMLRSDIKSFTCTISEEIVR